MENTPQARSEPAQQSRTGAHHGDTDSTATTKPDAEANTDGECIAKAEPDSIKYLLAQPGGEPTTVMSSSSQAINAPAGP